MIEINRETGEIRVPEISREDREKLWAALAVALVQKQVEEEIARCK